MTLELRVATADLIEGTDAVSLPLTGDEDGDSHPEGEGVMLERRSVPKTNKGVDETFDISTLIWNMIQADLSCCGDLSVVGTRRKT